MDQTIDLMDAKMNSFIVLLNYQYMLSWLQDFFLADVVCFVLFNPSLAQVSHSFQTQA